MSRPRKIHKPLKAEFNNILAAIATGQGDAKKAAQNLAVKKPTPPKKP